MDEVVRMKPIICNSESVRAILDGRKSQTRRVIKPQPEPAVDYLLWRNGKWQGYMEPGEPTVWNWKCPYGIPGDTLWLKETWNPFITANPPTSLYDNKAGYGIKYKADGARDFEGFSANIITDLVAKSMRWRSPIYMPRWASRITLEIKDVRVERVQDISIEDVVAEGIDSSRFYEHDPYDGDVTGWDVVWGIDLYGDLWDSINAKPKPTYYDKKILHYTSYPFDGEKETRIHRGKPWYILPNPWNWAITFGVEVVKGR